MSGASEPLVVGHGGEAVQVDALASPPPLRPGRSHDAVPKDIHVATLIARPP
ncbi:MAG: hypothetical protein IPK80_28790 [Nannocystis sp.]|nr:hypothetical protein [Nannocystis sp.]